MQIVRVGELADQIGGAHRAGLVGGGAVIVVVGDRKAGAFDRAGDALGVDLQSSALIGS